MSSQERRPRRPVHFGPVAMEAHGGTLPGPAELTEVAHHSAAVLLGVGRAADDPEVTARLVALVDELGLDTLADLWSTRPARSLPGALWRLYAVREWVHRRPVEAATQYAAGVRHAGVAHAIAGVAEPPGPDEVRALVDTILGGVFRGDFAVALERAGAFALVVAAGRAEVAHDRDATGEADLASELTRTGAALQETGQDLFGCAAAWRAGTLD